VAAVALLLAACSGDDNGVGGDGGTAGGDAASAYCTAVAGAKADVDRLDALADATTPEETEALFQGGVDAINRMADETPDEIADEFAIVVPAFEELLSVLSDADWDVAAVAADPEAQALLAEFDSGEVSDAQDAIDVFTEQECGIALSGDDSSGDDSSGDGEDAATATSTPDASDGSSAVGEGDVSALALEIGSSFAEGFGVTLDETQTGCVGQALIDAFGVEGLAAFGEAGSQPTNDQLQEVVGVFETCGIDFGSLEGVDGAATAEQLGDAIAASSGITLTAEQRACVGQGMVDLYGLERLVQLGQPGAQPTADELTDTLTLFTSCGVEAP
jgi:hypothetical protein